MPRKLTFTAATWLVLSCFLFCNNRAFGFTKTRLKTQTREHFVTNPRSKFIHRENSVLRGAENNKNRIGDDEKKKLFKDMISVALPALAACIVEPLLTIVDSFCIGQYMSTLESTNGLAGMSVNGAIFNILAAATYPLCTATTALVSDSMGKMEAQRDAAKASNSPTK